MEHTNLFLYEDNAALLADYPNGKVESPIPGVAYARSNNKRPIVIYNKKITNYIVTVNYQDRSGNTLTASTTISSPDVFEGNTVKVNVVGLEIDNCKPIYPAEKIEISADTTYNYLYLLATSYTITVHHVCEGSAITADTTVTVPAYEDETVYVELIPEEVQGYVAPEPVTISVSGNVEYNLNYEVACALELVDLGLPSGTLWASKNLGANTADDLGGLYAWGEITPKTAFTEENYRFYVGPDQEYSKYNSTDGKRVLEPDDDAATVAYSACGAHMPTVAQVLELLNNTIEEVLYSGDYITAYTYTSTANGNSIKIVVPTGYRDRNGDGSLAYWTCEENTYNLGERVPLDNYEYLAPNFAYVDKGTKYAAGVIQPCEGSTVISDIERWGTANYTVPSSDPSYGETLGLCVRPVVGEGPSIDDFISLVPLPIENL